jgi:hypothetical protein
MHQVMIRYKVKPDQVTDNLELLREFYEELQSTQPEGLRHATFQFDDGVGFVQFHESQSHASLARLTTFQRFRSSLEQQCAEPATMSHLRVVGSYRLL